MSKSRCSAASKRAGRRLKTRGGFNRHHVSGATSLALSFAIKAVAATFSITGLGEMFSAAFWPVVAMGVVLEAGQLRAASWLHSYWRNSAVGWALRTYGLLAVAVLMVINGIGVYGFLSRAYIGQAAHDGTARAQLAALEAQVTADQTVITASQAALAQKAALARAYEAVGALTKASGQIAAQAGDKQQIARAEADIASVEVAEVPVRSALSNTANRLGPMQYVASALGWHDTDAAVRLVILMIISAFDPLAAVLLITASISFNAAAEQARPAVPVSALPAVPTVPTPVVPKKPRAVRRKRQGIELSDVVVPLVHPSRKAAMVVIDTPSATQPDLFGVPRALPAPARAGR